MLKLDHLVVCASTLESAQAHVEAALGVQLQTGGTHVLFQTHNVLLGLEDGIYLEAIAPVPSAPAPGRARLFDLDRFQGPPRLSNWVCAVPDLEQALAVLPAGLGDPVAVSRGSLSWRMAVSADGTTPFDGLWPVIIEWPAGVHPSQQLASSGVRLRRFSLSHPDGDALRNSLSAVLTDDRISVETGPVGVRADFATPHGDRRL